MLGCGQQHLFICIWGKNKSKMLGSFILMKYFHDMCDLYYILDNGLWEYLGASVYSNMISNFKES